MDRILPASGRTIASLFFLTLFSCQSMAQEADPPNESTESEAIVEGTEEKDPDRGRFLALPFFITEPAIGEGFGGALMYFHGKKDIDEPTISTADDIGKMDRKNKPPTTMTGLFAFGTNNDTVGAGIAHRRTFKNDLYRFSAIAAYADVRTTFYVRDFPFNFSMEGSFFYSNLKRRIVGSNFFVAFWNRLRMQQLTSILDQEIDAIPASGISRLPASALRAVLYTTDETIRRCQITANW